MILQKIHGVFASRHLSVYVRARLLEMAEKRWRRIRSPELVQDVLDGTKFLDGRSDQEQNPEERSA